LESQIITALEEGFSFLSSNQLPSGEFATRQWIGDNACERALKFPVKSVFITSFVLHSLKEISKFIDVEQIAHKAIEFLLAEMEDNGIWRFYGKKSNIPFDIDCTCCVLAALKEWEIDMDYEAIASRLLRYRNSENVFNTWILDVDPCFFEMRYNNIDWVVNANVLFFYSLLHQRLPEVEQYLLSIVETEAFKQRSTYYPSISGIYCLTRAYADGHNSALEPAIPKIKDHLLNTKAENKLEDSISNALLSIALQNCYKGKAPVAQSIEYLLSMQRMDGGWPTGVFFNSIVGECPEIIFKWGSEELTTAFALETVSKYLQKSG
jgi:hypothetical protein